MFGSRLLASLLVKGERGSRGCRPNRWLVLDSVGCRLPAEFRAPDSAWLGEIQPEPEICSSGGKAKGVQASQEGEAAKDGVLLVGMEGSVGTPRPGSLGLPAARAEPQLRGVVLSPNQERGARKGNFRTIKGNPLPPVQPSLGTHPRKKPQPQKAAAGLEKPAASLWNQ